jgi:Armadillo/beta-catenin-like repeat
VCCVHIHAPLYSLIDIHTHTHTHTHTHATPTMCTRAHPYFTRNARTLQHPHLNVHSYTHIHTLPHTHTESTQREVFLSNGLPLLIKFLAHHNAQIKLAAMWCIFNLSNLVEAQQAVWNMKALKPLVQLLKSEKGEDERCVLVGILGNLCQQEIVRQALVHMGAISPIVRLMWGKRYTLETNRNAVAAVRLLVYEPAAVRGVIQLGGIPRLIELIQSVDDHIREYSITALSNMALDDTARRTIVQKGGVVHFLTALEISSDPYFQLSSLSVLSFLFSL